MTTLQRKLLKVKLKPGSKSKVETLLLWMRENSAFVQDEMEQLRYSWDSVYFEEGGEGAADFLYVVAVSKDWANKGEVERPTPFREVYEKFKDETWDFPEQYDDLYAP